jgi:hypothetical protein
LLFPELCERSGQMAACVLTGWNQKQSSVLDALEFTLRDAGLGWIAFIVRRIDRQNRGLNALQSR